MDSEGEETPAWGVEACDWLDSGRIRLVFWAHILSEVNRCPK